MPAQPAVSSATTEDAFQSAEANVHLDSPELALERDVRTLGAALDAARRARTPEELRATQKLAHDVMVRAEQGAFAEVASAVFHIEDALGAMADGELESNETTWRQVGAAYGAARAACALGKRESLAPESPRALGTLLLLLRDEQLANEVARAAARRKFSVAITTTAEDARVLAARGDFTGLVLDFHEDSPEEAEALTVSLRSYPGTARCPLIALAKSPNFALRLMAAKSNTALLLPKPLNGEKVLVALESVEVRDNPERPRVLLLTADVNHAEPITSILTNLGSSVAVFQESDQIVETLDATQPAALFLDRLGSIANDLCRLLRAIPRWRDLQILLRSADTEGPVSGYEAGADDVFGMHAGEREIGARLRVRLERTRMFREQSNRDQLTGLLTRRALTESMAARLAEAQRAKRHLSVCFLDIDRFKQVNDNYGHAVGDKVLASFGALLGSRFRLPDLRGRWGGEEFVLAFYGEWAESAREIVSRVMAEFSNISFDSGDGRAFHVTVSGGIATFPVDGQKLDDLVLVADQRLYAAKLAGRNRIRI